MCEMVLTLPSRKRHVTEAWSIPVEVPTAVTKTCSSRQADLNPLASLHDGQFSPSALTFSFLAAPVHPHAQVQDVSRLPTLNHVYFEICSLRGVGLALSASI